MTVYLHDKDTMKGVIEQYLHRFNNATALYSTYFERECEEKDKYEKCWQEIVALSIALTERLQTLGWSFPGGDTFGLFTSSYHRLAGCAPNSDEAIDALIDLKRFAEQLRDMIAEGRNG